MNYGGNNSREVLEEMRSNINVLGNNNHFVVGDSQLSIVVTGNNNRFDIRTSNVSFVVNGNNNQMEGRRSKVAFGFNGNNNTLAADSQCQIRYKFDNGYNNRHPQVNRNQPQEQPRNNRNQSNNRNVQPQSLHRNRNPPPQSNNNQVSNSQRRNQPLQNNVNVRNHERNGNHRQQQQVRENYQPPQRARINIFNNQGQYGVNPLYDNPDFLAQMGQIFPQFLNQNRFFQQMGPSFRQYRFSNNEEEDSEEEEKGLSEQELSLLPCSKHKGKTTNCTICICEVQQNEEETFLMCFHSFHSPCIKNWLTKNGTCPVCQFDLREHLRG